MADGRAYNDWEVLSLAATLPPSWQEPIETCGEKSIYMLSNHCFYVVPGHATEMVRANTRCCGKCTEPTAQRDNATLDMCIRERAVLLQNAIAGATGRGFDQHPEALHYPTFSRSQAAASSCMLT